MPAGTRKGRCVSKGKLLLAVVLVVQLACSVFFVSEIVLTIFNLRVRPVSWQTRELMEIGATIGLIIGSVIGGIYLRNSLRRTAMAEQKLKAASGAFMDVMEERFDDWGLTPAERDVALFAIKGMSIQEIAALLSLSALLGMLAGSLDREPLLARADGTPRAPVQDPTRLRVPLVALGVPARGSVSHVCPFAQHQDRNGDPRAHRLLGDAQQHRHHAGARGVVHGQRLVR